MANKHKAAAAHQKAALKHLPIFLAALLLFFLVLHFTGLVTLSDWRALLNGKTAPQADFSVSFVDVGQGDCTYIHSGSMDVLVDAGEAEYGDRVVQYLKEAGVEQLDYVIATHPHSDHIGGLPAVLEAFSVDEVLMSDIPDALLPTSKSYENLLGAIDASGAALSIVQPGDNFSLDGAALSILGPRGKDYDDLNDYSMVALLTTGDYRFLLTGDMSSPAEKDLLKADTLTPVTVLKVGHHGSSSSSTKKFLETVEPKYAIISCGVDNSYNHPNEKTVERLLGYTNEVYRTDLQGTVTFLVNGPALSLQTERP